MKEPPGGYKEIVANISGEGVYGIMKYESGVHRVQRVPATETQGRVHTSAATVAVLPEAEEVDVELNPGGYPQGYLLFVRSRRAIGEYHLFGYSFDAYPHGNRGDLSG